jgi:hypothetical protein
LNTTERFVAYGYSQDWFRDFSADFPNAVERPGFSPEELLKWFREKHLDPNFKYHSIPYAADGAAFPGTEMNVKLRPEP